jgi:hypothetical protein
MDTSEHESDADMERARSMDTSEHESDSDMEPARSSTLGHERQLVGLEGVDIDRVCIPRFPTSFIDRYIHRHSEVDLATTPPYQHSEMDLGLCIVSAPIGLYINDTLHLPFFNALLHECPLRYLNLSTSHNRFLDSRSPRKINMTHICNALTASRIEHIGVFSYGQKSSAHIYTFLDELPTDTFISLDIGFHIYTAHYDDTVPVVSHHGPPTYQHGRTTQFPMFSHIARHNDHTHGGLLWAYDHHSTIQSLKLYPIFTHILKARTPSNFLTLPSNAFQTRQRINQLCQFYLFLNSSLDTSDPRGLFNYTRELRAETRATYTTDLLDTVLRSKVFASDFLRLCCINNLTLSSIVQNLDEFINLTSLYDIGRGRNESKLSLDNRAIIATTMNQAGAATQRVIENMQLPDENNRYRFQRSLVNRPRLCRAPRATTPPSTVPAPPTVLRTPPTVPPTVPVDIDAAVAAAMAIVPPPQSDLGEIRRHVNITGAPRRKVAIRTNQGRLVKTATT